MTLGFDGADQPAPDIFNRCIRCGLCLPTCPTYLETLNETSGPRGRIGLIKAVAEGRIDLLSPGFVSQMSECLDCRACEAACPSGVAYGQLVETARSQIRRAQDGKGEGNGAGRLVLRALFDRLGYLRAAAVLLRVAQVTGVTSVARWLGFRELVALAPRVGARFFTPRGQRFDVPRPQGLAFLHAGCIMQVAFPQVHEATVRMLMRGGLSVVVPEGQGCCGALAIHAGDREFGRTLAKRNIEAFERSGADVLVSNAAGCGSALKEYAEYFRDDPAWSQRAASFSARVRDVTEVLDAVDLGPPSASLETTVTYQEPCHLAHAQRVSGAPRRLLQLIPGLRLIEMAESAVCCGGAGTYNVTQPGMSRRLRKRKVDAAAATGASVVATGNPGCAIQVSAGLREIGAKARVRHIVELLDDAYRERKHERPRA